MYNPAWGTINADWMEVYTPEEIVEKLDPKFKWQGPGWYPKVNGVDTLYIGGNGPKYQVYCYNERDPRIDIMQSVSTLLSQPERLPQKTK